MAAVVGAGFKFHKTAEEPAPDHRPAVLVKEPRSVRHAAESRAEALAVAAEFIRTAVARKNVDRSWRLAAPQLRNGFTRAEWARGNIPVVPFPVESARWKLEYSYKHTLGLRVALFPPPKAQVRPTVFDIELSAVKTGNERRWRVASILPSVARAPVDPRQQPTRVMPQLGVPDGEGRLGAAWLFVPLGLLSLIVVVPAAVAVAHWRRSSRAAREYARERGRPLAPLPPPRT